MNTFLHETLYRGDEALGKLAACRVTVCGAGAIGSLLVDNLTRQGFQKLRVIDFDRIEEHNVGTQIYAIGDVGTRKVNALRSHVYRATGVEIDARNKRIEEHTAIALLRQSDLVIDALDNHDSRSLVQRHCRNASLDCLHVGLSADYCEVIWDEGYSVPEDVGDDACEYPLARNLVIMAVALASESIIDFVLHREMRNVTMTLKDFAVNDLQVK